MGTATDRLATKLGGAALIPAHDRISKGGKRVHVEMYRRGGKVYRRESLVAEEGLNDDLRKYGTDVKAWGQDLVLGDLIAHDNGVHQVVSKKFRPATPFLDVSVKTVAGRKATNFTFGLKESVRKVKRRKGVLAAWYKPLRVALAASDVKAHVRFNPDGSPVFVKGYKRTFNPLELNTLASRVNLQDQRTGGPPLKINPKGLEAALVAAGVQMGPKLKIRLRLRDQNSSGTDQGLTQKIGDDEYRVVVKVAKKAAFKEHHLYIIANSLVHELRHVRQMQDDKDHGQKYHEQNLTVGYNENKYEIEAREYGRLADPTGERAWKGIPEGMQQLGKVIWALIPA